MTTLDAYLRREGATTLTKLSEAMGVSKSRLSQLRESTDWPPQLALNAERATDGKLNAGDLSPIVRDARRSAVAA